MSSPKYAAMTASLLARKGDAAPSVLIPSIHPPIATESVAIVHNNLAFQNATIPPPFPEAHPLRPPPSVPVWHVPHSPMDEADKPRRMMILVARDEMERIDIAAIKKGVTRHEIVREALDAYFQKLVSELPQPCNCIANGNCCG